MLLTRLSSRCGHRTAVQHLSRLLPRMGWISGFALLAMMLAFPRPARADALVLTADRMIDVVRGRVVERPVVLIKDDRIAALFPSPGEIPVGASRLDLPGKTLLPGLIDMHVHLDGSPLVRDYRKLDYTDSFEVVLAVPNAWKTLRAGFTTVRALGDKNYADVAMRQAIDGGFLQGPRIIAATYPLGATGGHCDTNTNVPSLERRAPGVADGPDAVRAKVRELRKLGAQVLKVCATGGVFSRNTQPGTQQMTLAELTAAVEEAHMLGMKVAAHAHGTSGIKAAILAGVDTVEHASLIDSEGIRLAKRKGTWLGFDIYNTEYTLAEGLRNGVFPENIEKERQLGEIQRANFSKAVAAGVKMIYSTDSGVYPHGDNAKQFAVMVRYGMTPMQAIRSATVNAAKALGLEDKVGAIEPGRYADIIAVSGDPLASIRQLENVDLVMKGGKVVRDE